MLSLVAIKLHSRTKVFIHLVQGDWNLYALNSLRFFCVSKILDFREIFQDGDPVYPLLSRRKHEWSGTKITRNCYFWDTLHFVIWIGRFKRTLRHLLGGTQLARQNLKYGNNGMNKSPTFLLKHPHWNICTKVKFDFKQRRRAQIVSLKQLPVALAQDKNVLPHKQIPGGTAHDLRPVQNRDKWQVPHQCHPYPSLSRKKISKA